LSGSAELYRLIAGDRPADPGRAPLRRNLRIDFLFIAAYLLLYTGLALAVPLLASGVLGVLTGWRGWYAEWCMLAILPALPGIAVLAFRPDWFLRSF